MNQDVPGPLPTRLVFLSELPNLPVGSKVRFLGCVSKYTIAKGILTLEHNDSVSSPNRKGPRRAPGARIDVDVNLLLESLSHSDIDIGNWINVIGYVRPLSPAPSLVLQNEILKSGGGRKKPSSVYVEALMIIPAGGIRVGEYERVLSESREVDKRLKGSS
ncbi:hypothetical protein D8B26_003423 [Coccidioides posadasii str. Silveira]|uniref:Uncharacterized protein n=2 Tax=Coccidioides posadasii TaxID=199306 RepID=E9CZM8_COCPS|nr:conserved hypothetical protein [Coccidioides posadasii str. Silveira]KMM73303.1 hypothetical protein CPAG_09592 [Coccidioides posadasii RMSCC 3488]QVM08748.1 hypothetical protein D8B26_003423 [Coccidioides posadasii str. Silveira]